MFLQKHVLLNLKEVTKMNRCSKCILPDSLENSHFNQKNECHWCQTGFPNYEPKGIEKIHDKIIKNPNEAYADCLVGLSGGKDSSYTLYKLVKELGYKAEAFTYIHEGTADFSLENAKNVCKQLGVKHHIVTLKNQAHLKSFQDYFISWMENPTAVSAGMTCVACKHLHIFGYKLAVERHIPNIVWSSSPHEYAPFLAIKPKQDKSNPFKREGLTKGFIKLLDQSVHSPKFTKALLKNLSVSFWGTISAFPTSSYLKYRFPKVNSVMFYDYEDWNPIHIKREVMEKLDWRIPQEIKEDWHSDCIFNIFKEYMFQKMYGVSYTDALLSNEIRYGIISREEAMRDLKISKENFSKAINEALKVVGLEQYKDKIDHACFEVK